MKGKVYKTVVRPGMSYGLEQGSLTDVKVCTNLLTTHSFEAGKHLRHAGQGPSMSGVRHPWFRDCGTEEKTGSRVVGSRG